MGVASFKGAGMNTPHLVAGKKVLISHPSAGHQDSCIDHPCSPCFQPAEIVWPLEHISSHHAEDKTVCGLL